MNNNFPKYVLLEKAKQEDLFVALNLFEGYWKVYSILALKLMSFPILKGIILTTYDNEVKEQILEFARSFNYTELLLRHDRKPELLTEPRGGYIVSLKKLGKELSFFFKQERIVILFEPASPYDDIYSCNALFDFVTGNVSLEIVGPGFDASDLNRGDITPHELYECSLYSRLRAEWHRIYKVDREMYRASVNERLLKIGRSVIGSFNIEGKPRLKKNYSLEQIKSIGHKFLVDNNKDLLLQHLDNYQEFPLKYLKQIEPYIRRVPNNLEELGIKYNRYLNLSMGFLKNVGLIFWDMVIPAKKYLLEREKPTYFSIIP